MVYHHAFVLIVVVGGTERSTVIVGRSVHNQRMWRYVYQGVLGYFHDLFYHLESVGMLHPICTSSAFTHPPNYWKQAWAKHPMRSDIT